MGGFLDKVTQAAGPPGLLPSHASQEMLHDWAAGHDGHGHPVLPEIRDAAQVRLAGLGAEGPRAEEDYENKPRGIGPRDEEEGEDWDEHDWDDVRSHLESQSPWFGKVMRGESPGDPDSEVRLTPRTAEASTVHEPTVPPGGPGLFRIKGRQLPPYVQHLYKHLVGKYGKHGAYRVAIGIVKRWKEGINPGGKKGTKEHHVHKDVQAAAARNIADWEESKAMAHHHGEHGDHKDKVAATAAALAAPAAWPSGKPYAASFLLQGKQTNTGVISSAPGAKPIQPLGLRQTPSQTVSPSPPLPPGVSLPDPKDLERLASTVQDGADPVMATSVRKHLHTAAGKLRSDDRDGALYALRGAQTGLHSAYRAAYGANQPWTAKVFEEAGFQGKIPPAEVSSARTEMLKGRAVTEHYRQAHHQVAVAIDALRRAHFHGMYANMPEARF